MTRGGPLTILSVALGLLIFSGIIAAWMCGDGSGSRSLGP